MRVPIIPAVCELVMGGGITPSFQSAESDLRRQPLPSYYTIYTSGPCWSVFFYNFQTDSTFTAALSRFECYLCDWPLGILTSVPPRPTDRPSTVKPRGDWWPIWVWPGGAVVPDQRPVLPPVVAADVAGRGCRFRSAARPPLVTGGR